VFQGLFAVARRFYLLFQQHCRYDNAASISATLGEYSYHQVRRLNELECKQTYGLQQFRRVLPWIMM
jgi:hypothetical protein